jgi:hypothetical protein
MYRRVARTRGSATVSSCWAVRCAHKGREGEAYRRRTRFEVARGVAVVGHKGSGGEGGGKRGWKIRI